jgi:hypothetical protein
LEPKILGKNSKKKEKADNDLLFAALEGVYAFVLF